VNLPLKTGAGQRKHYRTKAARKPHESRTEGTGTRLPEGAIFYFFL